MHRQGEVLSWQDLEAYLRLTAHRMAPWQVRFVMALEAHYRTESERARKAREVAERRPGRREGAP